MGLKAMPVIDPASIVRAPQAWQKFATLPDGAVPSTDAAGRPVALFESPAGAGFVVKQGALRNLVFDGAPSPGAAQMAAYYQTTHDAPVRSIGGVWRWAAGDAVGSSVTFVIARESWSALFPGGVLPEAALHVAVTPSRVDVGTITGNSMTSLLAYDLAAPLAVGVPHRVDVSIAGSVATISLPDGTVRKVTHANIAAGSGVYASHETFCTAEGAGQRHVLWDEVWSGTVANDAPMPGSGAASVLQHARSYADGAVGTLAGTVEKTADLGTAGHPPALGARNISVAGTVIGNRAPANSESNTGLSATYQETNPNHAFMGALSGFAFYSGTEGESSGPVMGGSANVNCFLNGSNNWNQGAIAWEASAIVGGDASRTLREAVSLLTTPRISGSVTVQEMIGVKAGAPTSDGGSPTIDNAYSVKAFHPTIGTNRYAIWVEGRTYLRPKTGQGNCFEIASDTYTKRWAVIGNAADQIIGYASDGASTRIAFDTSDGAEYRERLIAQAGTTVVSRLESVGAMSANMLEIAPGGTLAFSFGPLGLPRWHGSNQQSTVGAAGGASALPATPTTYLKAVTSDGTTVVIPAYAAS